MEKRRKFIKNIFEYIIILLILILKIIIEMDGGLGHGNHKYKSSEIDIEGKQRDLIKDQLAEINGITLVRIDCINSNFEYIKTNILTSFIISIIIMLGFILIIISFPLFQIAKMLGEIYQIFLKLLYLLHKFSIFINSSDTSTY